MRCYSQLCAYSAVQVAEPETETEIGTDDPSTGGATNPSIGTDIGETVDKGPSEPRIRCPKCDWSPGAGDRWMCKCRHTWNTFDTGGVCPACLYQWQITQCLSCRQVSAHSDWYA